MLPYICVSTFEFKGRLEARELTAPRRSGIYLSQEERYELLDLRRHGGLDFEVSQSKEEEQCLFLWG